VPDDKVEIMKNRFEIKLWEHSFHYC
jgi:hypothetical protein